MKLTLHITRLAVLVIVVLGLIVPSMAAVPTCRTNNAPGNVYTVQLCFTTLDSTNNLSGLVPIPMSVATTGSSPGVVKLTVFLNGVHLLSDYTSPYTFDFPTNHYADGTYNLGL